MIYQYSLLHLLFVIAMTLLWRMVDKRLDFKNYLIITLVVGWIGTFGYDFLGVFVYRFWGYNSENAFEYLAIAAGTYVIVTPLLIEVFGFFLQYLSRVKLDYGHKLNRGVAISLIGLSATIVATLTVLRYFEAVYPGWGYFLAIALAGITLLDQVIFVVRGVRGPISLLIEGRALSLLVVPISGFVCGFLWELLNLQFPLWYYQNLPPERFLGVPLVAILFWGVLNMGYWALTNLLFPQLKLRRQL